MIMHLGDYSTYMYCTKYISLSMEFYNTRAYGVQLDIPQNIPKHNS